MPKYRPNPKQWLPDAAVDAAGKMNLLQAWSQYCEHIAQYRKFKDAPATILDYTSTLIQIEAALGEKAIYQLDPFAIMDIVASSPGRVNSRGEYVEYSMHTLIKRLTIIRDIFLYLESAYNCFNPLSYEMYTLLGRVWWAEKRVQKQKRSCGRNVKIKFCRDISPSNKSKN